MRRAALALVATAATAWATGNAVLGAVVAPAVFGTARDNPGWLTVPYQTIGGETFATALGRWLVIAWGLCALVALGLAVLSARRRAAPAILSLAALVACVTVHWLCGGMFARAQALVPAVRAGDATAQAAFDELHVSASRWLRGETALAAGVAVAALIALVRRPRATISRESIARESIPAASAPPPAA
ncbi:MAG TPA: hypothetical protein VEL07_21210 [Planctomycetota bacterium]|nr:hypothetical protein [Planctomycetota bacterium]